MLGCFIFFRASWRLRVSFGITVSGGSVSFLWAEWSNALGFFLFYIFTHHFSNTSIHCRRVPVKHAYLSPLEVYFFQPRDPQLIPFALPFSVRCLLILPSLYTYTLVLSPPIPPAYLPTEHESGGLNVFLLPFLSRKILVSVTFAFAV